MEEVDGRPSLGGFLFSEKSDVRLRLLLAPFMSLGGGEGELLLLLRFLVFEGEALLLFVLFSVGADSRLLFLVWRSDRRVVPQVSETITFPSPFLITTRTRPRCSSRRGILYLGSSSVYRSGVQSKMRLILRMMLGATRRDSWPNGSSSWGVLLSGEDVGSAADSADTYGFLQESGPLGLKSTT